MKIRATAAALAAAATCACAATAQAQSPLGAKAERQIAALQDIKRSLTPAERKLDSQLAVELRARRDRSATAPLPRLSTGVEVSASGTTDVDVRAEKVGDDLLSRLRRAGARVVYASERTDSVRARVPLSALREVASWGDVERVEVAAEWMTHQAAPVVSEGDKAHAADVARTRRRVTGTGVKVCVLSDGVTGLAAAQARGELPAVDVLPGQGGSGNEGTAMLEIVHDVAPNAELGFATAVRSDASFADNIRRLRFEAGCDVIVDDILYFNEHPFQDGPIAQAVNAVTADGALFFSSAGNEGNTIDGTSGTYEGDFVDSGRPVGKFAGTAHDFDPGPGVQVFQPVSPASGAVPVTLFWAEALGRAASDYDLYLFDANENVVAFSQAVQNGDDNPYERLDTRGGSSMRLAVVRFRGDARYFQLSALRGRFKNSSDGLIGFATPGVTRGHSAAVNAFSTAAAPASVRFTGSFEPGDPLSPTGPFPEPFTAAQLPERFTSDGPRRVFFHADGTPITPGNYSSTGGTVRQKPDITAADGVVTSVPGFTRFFGTSAAAPHAAAIAALVLSGNPGAGNAEVREAFNATALDLTPAGVDRRTGEGVIRADRVLNYTGATPQPLVRAGDVTVTPDTGDGDAYLEPGESALVALPVTNVGDGTATGVNVTATTDDARARLTPRTQTYGNVARGATKTRNFRLTLAETFPLGKRVLLTARVGFAGALSPTERTQAIATGQPGTQVTTFSYAGPPVPIPDDDPAGASVTIPVAGFGYASRITFSVDGTECNTTAGSTTVGIDHTFVGDLVGTLTAPGGQSATLFQRNGSSGNNLCQVVFDDAAERPFSSVTSTAAPFTGTWRPATPLAGLTEGSADGDWTLRIVDEAGSDSGVIRAVSLRLTGFVED